MFLSALCLVLASAPPPPEARLDLKPLREPLDRAAAALERALGRLEALPLLVENAVHFTSIAVAVLLTVVVMTVIHQHGLAASKENRRP
jgi:hypothetical protein